MANLRQLMAGLMLAGGLIPAAVQGQVVISEFMAANKTVLKDENSEYSDWIELHNTNDTPVNLNGWGLTDNANNLTKWRLPDTNIVADGYLVVFASSKNRAVPGQELHTSFALSAGGEYLGLVLSNGTTIVSQYAPTFPEQFDDISYGLQDGVAHYFSQPTPGAPNDTNFFAQVADTKFDHDRGFYETPFSLVITTKTAGASIRYTTNGQPVTATNGPVYTNAFVIDRTTVLRAAAFKNGFEPSNVDTVTYLFLGDVLRQSTNGAAPPGWPATWGINRVDYGMDPEVVTNALYRNTITNDLKTIPSVSLVMKLEDLFNSSNGIYANAFQSGSAWERPVSVELIYPDGTKGFQIDAGLRIRGNFSTDDENPKHSFRVLFRGEYGDKQLKFPLFGTNNATDTFEGGFDLATFQNHSWSNPGNPGGNGLFLRDHFARDTQLAMGHPAERGIYAHLYINGQYWGIYSPSERPEADYAASYFGGESEDYDVIKATGATNYIIEATDGDMAAWTRLWEAATNGFTTDAAYQQVQGNHPDGTRNPAQEILVEVDNLIDYELIFMYVGSRDGPVVAAGSSPNNWFGIFRRDGTMGFRFFVHDFEHTLLNVNEDRTGPFSAGNPVGGGGLLKSSPQYIWQQLLANEEFRVRAGDRIHRHFFNGGLLTPAACLARFRVRTNQLDRAVVGESARWGDANRFPPLSPYTRNGSWLPLVASMEANYFPQRSGIVLNQLKAKNLYPAVAAPVFSQHGGNVTNAFPLTMAASAGIIYYTTNGTDPRVTGGGVAPSSLTYTSAVALRFSGSVQARAWSNGVWSARNEAVFTVAPPTLAQWLADYFSLEELADANVGTAGADADGDGLTNEQEFWSGTHPRDAASALRVANLALVPGTNAVTFEFPAMAGHSYSVQFRAALAEGNWVGLTNFSAVTTNRVVSVQDAVPVSSNRYYRVVTPLVP